MKFEIRTVLALYTGKYIAPLAEIHQLVAYMAGMEIYTNQMIRVREELLPSLEQQFPWLIEIDYPEWTDDESNRMRDVELWVSGIACIHGRTLDVEPSTAVTKLNPCTEWQMDRMMHGLPKTITIVVC